MKDVHIARGALIAIAEHARRDAPNECCGLLVADGTAIVDAVEVRNEAASPTRYRVAPAEHFALIKRLRGTTRRIVGAYHSHPRSPAIPSTTDVAEAWETGFLYLIVSLEDEARPDVRAYQLEDGNFVPVTLVATDAGLNAD